LKNKVILKLVKTKEGSTIKRYFG